MLSTENDLDQKIIVSLKINHNEPMLLCTRCNKCIESVYEDTA
jgi:hypothetical protein